MDKLGEALIAALKVAATAPTALPLFKVGKAAGLLPTRTGVNAEAAQRALAEGLLEAAPGIDASQATTELFHITPRGIQFLYQHESPRAVLEELIATLQVHRDGMSGWHEELKSLLLALAARLQQHLDRQSAQIEQLGRRADEALKRLDAPHRNDVLASWQLDVLTYLGMRMSTGRPGDCPLSEVFRAVRPNHDSLTLGSFHSGLSALRDRGALELVAFPGSLDEVPEPECALVEGSSVYTAVRRA